MRLGWDGQVGTSQQLAQEQQVISRSGRTVELALRQGRTTPELVTQTGARAEARSPVPT